MTAKWRDELGRESDVPVGSTFCKFCSRQVLADEYQKHINGPSACRALRNVDAMMREGYERLGTAALRAAPKGVDIRKSETLFVPSALVRQRHGNEPVWSDARQDSEPWAPSWYCKLTRLISDPVKLARLAERYCEGGLDRDAVETIIMMEEDRRHIDDDM